MICLDAVPKKRGPKTDVLEALLKRVDGLEARLREKKDDESSAAQALATSSETELARSLVADVGEQEPQPPPAKRLAVDPSISPRGDATASLTPKTPVSKFAALFTYPAWELQLTRFIGSHLHPPAPMPFSTPISQNSTQDRIISWTRLLLDSACGSTSCLISSFAPSPLFPQGRTHCRSLTCPSFG